MQVGFIGAGNMGGALAKAVSSVLGPAAVAVSDADAAKAAALAEEIGCTVASNLELIAACDYVFLGVKPQVLPAVLAEIGAPAQENGHLTLICMAAGVPLSTVTAAVGKVGVIRIMPNLPVSVGEGMILYTMSDTVSVDAQEDFLHMLSAAGKLDELKEADFDAASAVSGCGPAFVGMFANALAQGGAACGITAEKALQYALQTVIGTAVLLEKTGVAPAALVKAVCSPAGSTIEGVHVLENEGFTDICKTAVQASYKRTKELGRS